jgi:hypothetical protein
MALNCYPIFMLLNQLLGLILNTGGNRQYDTPLVNHMSGVGTIRHSMLPINTSILILTGMTV